jgi:hypothetical protein
MSKIQDFEKIIIEPSTTLENAYDVHVIIRMTDGSAYLSKSGVAKELIADQGLEFALNYLIDSAFASAVAQRNIRCQP